jgi:hypothetical protein
MRAGLGRRAFFVRRQRETAGTLRNHRARSISDRVLIAGTLLEIVRYGSSLFRLGARRGGLAVCGILSAFFASSCCTPATALSME